jgi:hypothetical protein
VNGDRLRWAKIAACLACASLGGCAAPTTSDIAAEAERLAQPGISVEQAQAALASIGYRCGKKSDYRPGDAECDRDRSVYLVAGCIDRVYLTFNSDKTRIEHIQIYAPACASL